MSTFQFNMNKNNGNNIKKANQSKPKHTFNDLNKQKAQTHKKAPTTTMKVDLPTLAKIRALQAILAKNTRTETLDDLVNKIAIPILEKKGKINKDTFNKFVKVFSQKR